MIIPIVIISAILFAIVGPTILTVIYVMHLPRCTRCDDRMPDVDRHVCPDGETPAPLKVKEWPPQNRG